MKGISNLACGELTRSPLSMELGQIIYALRGTGP